MDIEEVRKNKRLLEAEMGKQVAMFCRNHDLILSDIDFTVQVVQTNDAAHREVSDVQVRFKMEL